jgi:SAM-dependent methyltransferase
VAGNPDPDEQARRRSDYEVERELAARLEQAPPERRRSLYAEVYRELFLRGEVLSSADAERRQVPLLLRLLEPFLVGGTRFLEIGAGSCELSLALADRLPRVWATDAVEPEWRGRSAQTSFSFVEADRLTDEVPSGGVDLALSCRYVERLHPEDLPGHLRDVLRLLAPRGRYVIVTPNRIYGPHDASRGFSERASGLHLREYTHGSLTRELRRAGFRDVRTITSDGETSATTMLAIITIVEWLIDAVPDRWRRAILARAPRQAPYRPLEQVKLVATKVPIGG